MSRLQEKYQKVVVPKLKKEFGVSANLAVPRILKIVINVGIGEITKDQNAIKKVTDYLSALAGQKPALMKAKSSIAEFKIRLGSPVGLRVTLRGKRAYDFLDKLFSITLARVREFRGLRKSSFDGQGNYTLGLTEQTIFPEVDYDKIDKTRGMEITIVTSAGTNVRALRLLEELGMPFEKGGE